MFMNKLHGSRHDKHDLSNLIKLYVNVDSVKLGIQLCCENRFFSLCFYINIFLMSYIYNNCFHNL